MPDVKLDLSQRSFCASKAERIRLLAPAGSGKTLSLLWRCKTIQERNAKKPQRFLIVTFTRGARDEIRHRIENDPDLAFLASHVQVNTLNALGYRHLRSQQSGLKLVSRKDAYSIFHHTLRPLWTENATMAQVLSSGNALNALKGDILDVFDVLKGLGFRHQSKNLIKDFVKNTKWIESVGLDRYFANAYQSRLDKMKLYEQHQQHDFIHFWATATEHLLRSNLLTFADQKYHALLKLEATTVAANQRFHHILVDEFQDVDPLDMNLIRTLVQIHKSTLTIAGDDDQAIFEWRGAVPKFILEPEKFLGGEFETHILEKNYRSPSNIVNHATRLIEHNEIRIPKTVQAKSTRKADISVREFATYQESCEFVMTLAKEMNQNDGQKLAILGRKRGQIIPYQILLAASDIPFFAKEDLNIFLQASFDSLRDILLMVSRRDDRRRRAPEVVNDFVGLLDKVKRYPLNKKDRAELNAHLHTKRPRSFDEAIEALMAYPGSLKNIDNERFYGPINRLLATKTVADTLNVLGEEFDGFSKDYGKAMSLEDIFYVDPPFLHLADYAQRYSDDYDAFLDDLEDAISHLKAQPVPEGEEQRDMDELRSIHLMTALRAKGKEYHTVVVLDAIDGIWPSRLAKTPAELEQERRLFYVAVTRPRERLYIVSHKSMLGESTTLSPYLQEMKLR
ncbi:MAG: ATP-dependent helicase [Candidatus Hydrogenedentes bacterium]|nr:ATP-dependent helicase [Candidatus Hydrogenedentota bacterium]